MEVQTDGRGTAIRWIPLCVLKDIIPFGAAAQKENNETLYGSTYLGNKETLNDDEEIVDTR